MMRNRGTNQAAHLVHQLADRLDNLLPQMQCGQCGHAGCRPYAEALARDVATPAQCRPGGLATAQALAQELDIATDGLLPQSPEPVRVARIDEDTCVGCYKCIEACPVDAIIGAHGLLHTVLAQQCTSCGACLAPCPVDCIAMVVSDDAGDGQLVQRGVIGLPQAQAAATRLRARHVAKKARPPLRAATGVATLQPAELARQAMNRARRRKRSSSGG